MDPGRQHAGGSPTTTLNRLFYAQIAAIYVIIGAALFNLTFGGRDGRELWISLLSSAIGYLLPAPYMQHG
jgi:hypothetical protein